MKRKRTAREMEILEDLRRTSGWYLAAWRDYKQLTLDELGAEMGEAKGRLSELETGKPDKNGVPRRYNRDLLDKAAAALNIAPGWLLDVNPFAADQTWMKIQEQLRQLGEADLQTVLRLVEAMPKRATG